MPGPLQTQNEPQQQGCGRARLPRDEPTFPQLRPSCPPPQRRGCSLQSWQSWQTLLDLTRCANMKRELKRAQEYRGECYSHSLHPLARVTGVPTSQTSCKIRRDSDPPHHAVINETAIYVIILMQSTLGPISSRKLMTLYSAVQC